jgi:hypothetical protein
MLSDNNVYDTAMCNCIWMTDADWSENGLMFSNSAGNGCSCRRTQASVVYCNGFQTMALIVNPDDCLDQWGEVAFNKDVGICGKEGSCVLSQVLCSWMRWADGWSRR